MDAEPKELALVFELLSAFAPFLENYLLTSIGVSYFTKESAYLDMFRSTLPKPRLSKIIT